MQMVSLKENNSNDFSQFRNQFNKTIRLDLMLYVMNRVSCKRMFNKRLKMTEHMRSHTGERFVACANCGSTFNSYVKFYDHFRRQAINSKNSRPHFYLIAKCF